MATFAKEQLMKYGWVEGKGLGKDESGITAPVNLTSNQNKEGIGYENNPWWETKYDNVIKNLEFDSHNCALRPKKHFCSTTSELIPQCRSSFIPFLRSQAIFLDDQKLKGVSCDKTAHESMEYKFTLNGKLKRIAEQDRLLLNPVSLNATRAEENAITWKNTESSSEESDYETQLIRSRVTEIIEPRKKKLETSVDNLVQQLDVVNLEKNSQADSLCSKKLGSILKGSQKIKKIKEEKRKIFKLFDIQHEIRKYDPKRIFNILISDLGSELNEEDRKKLLRKIELDRLGGRLAGQTFEFLSNNLFKGIEREVEWKWKKRGNGKDSTEHKVEQSLELRNSIKESGMIDKRHEDSPSKDCVKINSEERIEAKANPNVEQLMFLKRSGRIKQDNSKPDTNRNYVTCEIERRSIEEKEIMFWKRDRRADFYFQKLNQKLLKKKQRYCSKQIKKIAEKLKGEALSNELNSVIKNLSTFDLTEKVNANTIKKRLTQTNLTLV